jgi:hypothetical protein
MGFSAGVLGPLVLSLDLPLEFNGADGLMLDLGAEFHVSSKFWAVCFLRGLFLPSFSTLGTLGSIFGASSESFAVISGFCTSFFTYLGAEAI